MSTVMAAKCATAGATTTLVAANSTAKSLASNGATSLGAQGEGSMVANGAEGMAEKEEDGLRSVAPNGDSGEGSRTEAAQGLSAQQVSPIPAAAVRSASSSGGPPPGMLSEDAAKRSLKDQMPKIFPRPPGGYRYSMEFLYNIGTSMVGIVLDIPTSPSITPRSMRTTPPPPPLSLSLHQDAPQLSMSPPGQAQMSSGSRYSSGGMPATVVAPPGQFMYPGYVHSAPQQRRLWHTENAVWQFDRNYPFNQGYTQPYGVPMLPMGFEQNYGGGQRVYYPNYMNHSPGGSNRMSNRHNHNSAFASNTGNSQQQQQQQQRPTQVNSFQQSLQQQHMPQGTTANQQMEVPAPGNGTAPSFENGNVNEALLRLNRAKQQRNVGSGRGQTPNAAYNQLGFHGESKTFYNSATGSGGSRFNQAHNQRSLYPPNGEDQQPLQLQPQMQDQEQIPRGAQLSRWGPKVKKNNLGKKLISNSSDSLSSSSSKSNLEQSPSLTSITKHPKRTYRSQLHYAHSDPDGGAGNNYQQQLQLQNQQQQMQQQQQQEQQKQQQQLNPSQTMRRNKHNNSYNPMEYNKPMQHQSQQPRYYQARNMEEFGYINYGQNQGGIPETQSGAGMRPLTANSLVSQAHLDTELEELWISVCPEYSTDRVQEISEHEQEQEQEQDFALDCSLEDGQSFASWAPSVESDQSEGELSDASIESYVRSITMECVATATGTELPDLSGANLVPYGDMSHLNGMDSGGVTPSVSQSNGFRFPMPSSIPEHAQFREELELLQKNGEDTEEEDRSKTPVGCSSRSTLSAFYMDATAEYLLPLDQKNRYWREFYGYTPADRFMLRCKHVEIKRPPRTVPSRTRWESLSLDIWNKFLEAQQTSSIYKTKMRLWRFIYNLAVSQYPRYGLYLVGSSISNFGSKCSDMDMCMVGCTNPNLDPRSEAVYHLQMMRSLLSGTNKFQDFNLIEARVPILRFTDCKHKVEIDINFNNSVGIRNTHLLYCYSQLEWRVRPMALAVKQWAQHHNINNAKNMTISSYSLMLMVIHFLQSGVSPPVLPCLHKMYPKKFELLDTANSGYVDMNEVMAPYESQNTQTLGELMLSFLQYYSNFEFGKYAISIRVGGLLPIELCRAATAPKNDVHQWIELCIEEPFDQTNTARSVYDPDTFERVRAIFLCSFNRLESTRNLRSIFEDYEGPTIAMRSPSVDSEFKLPSSDSNSEAISPRLLKMVDKCTTAIWGEIKEKLPLTPTSYNSSSTNTVTIEPPQMGLAPQTYRSDH
ncbi:poly(A) RNA polymerase gld-2 homolog A [Drosophila madeirensis]|uniref:Poly(A) RNA polymerase gld-2 homolog A n=1 Tax=Drosophila madeirensis TaxID=30013 RepID=A0AAU9F4G8_DROMD